MIRNMAYIFFLSFYCFIPSLYSGTKPQAVELSKISLTNLPIFGSSLGLNMANGYIGMVSDYDTSAMTNKFYLFDSLGKEIFSVESNRGWNFYRVDMKSCKTAISVSEMRPEGPYRSYIFDYLGRLILPPIEDDSPIWPSPNCKYYYTKNNISFGSVPNIYDQTGHLLSTLSTKSDLWELLTINDSLLLFHNGNTIQIISVPDIKVEKEFFILGVEAPYMVYSTLSPDGFFYALTGQDKIAIYNLESGETNFIENDVIGEYIAKPNLILSAGAEYLLNYDRNGLRFSIYKRGDSGYKMIFDYSTKPNGPISFPHNVPFLSGDYCVVNYFYDSTGPVQYRSCLFKFRNLENETPYDIAFDGYLDEILSDDKSEFRLLQIDSPIKGVSSVMTLELKEANDD